MKTKWSEFRLERCSVCGPPGGAIHSSIYHSDVFMTVALSGSQILSE